MSKLDRYLLWALVLCASGVLILGLVMLLVLPSSADGLADGFRSPILAFEFARSEADLAFLSGSSESASQLRRQMDFAHRFDMVFPLAYAGMIALLLVAQARRGFYFAWLGLGVAITIIPADWHENWVMLQMTAWLEQGYSVAPLLVSLYWATWLKWGLIAVAIGVLSAGFLRERLWFRAGLSFLSSCLILLTWLSGAMGALAEVMFLVLTLFFIFFAVDVLWGLRNKSWAFSGSPEVLS